MKRLFLEPRAGWQQIVASQGLSFYMTGDEVYWDESACYSFTRPEIDVLEAATYELDRMCLAAVEHVVSRGLWDELHIPLPFRDWIAGSWERDERTIYGRFDFAFDGKGPPKLLEYNADTPTALLEAAVIQWFWWKDTLSHHAGADQFNSIHERLIEAWRMVESQLNGATLFFAGMVDEEAEDYTTVGYLRDTAMQAGLKTDWISIERIGWNARRKTFVDERNRTLDWVFKLYPWEWLMQEQFGSHLPLASTRWLEAPWKILLSNKAILPVLWRLFPDSPYLLRAEMQPWNDSYAEKPIFAREGANIRLVQNGQIRLETQGDYASVPRVYQELCPLPQFDGRYPVIGSWMVDGHACGIGIREDATPVTSNQSRFVPHVFGLEAG